MHLWFSSRHLFLLNSKNYNALLLINHFPVVLKSGILYIYESLCFSFAKSLAGKAKGPLTTFFHCCCQELMVNHITLRFQKIFVWELGLSIQPMKVLQTWVFNGLVCQVIILLFCSFIKRINLNSKINHITFLIYIYTVTTQMADM